MVRYVNVTQVKEGNDVAVTRIEIQRSETYANGASFGEIGVYERVDATVHYAVDPSNPRNVMIVDLDLAPRGPDGLVHFHGDLCLLIPVDRDRANGSLFLELPNRGRKLLTSYVHRARVDTAKDVDITPGDGFLLRHGFVVGWVGWQWDVYRDDVLMGLEPPQAVGVSGTTLVRFQPNEPRRSKLLADRVHKPLPAADLDEAGARLTRREFELGEPTVIPRDRWQFAREVDDGPVPDPEHIYMADGFEPGVFYEVTYTTTSAPVVGSGLLAARDVASFLRYEGGDNPCAGLLDRAYAFGISQTGRMLRHFIYLGMNLDESDRIVFDGVLSHVGGARRGEFNHRFGQPSVQNTPGFGHLFPFADEPMPHPDTGEVDGLLKRQREIGGVPRIFWTNSSAEYWRGDCGLLHIDPTGTRDLAPAPETRIYAFAGAQHDPGVVPLTNVNTNTGARGRYGFNAVDYSPMLRAAILNLDRWVTGAAEPPPSCHPRLDRGSAVTYREVMEKFPDIPGLHRPGLDGLRYFPRVDLGPDAGRGVGAFPAATGEHYPSFVWDIDEDGNEAADERPPDLSVPVGTYTAWNPRHPDTGAPGLILPMRGATFFLPRTAAERQASGDPRRSIEERYDSRDAYLEQVRIAARKLAARRYALDDDVDLIVDDAAARYDEAMRNRPV
jgi:hypothetical protein